MLDESDQQFIEGLRRFKPLLAETVLYVKLILRNDCIVVSFHEDEGGGHEEEDL